MRVNPCWYRRLWLAFGAGGAFDPQQLVGVGWRRSIWALGLRPVGSGSFVGDCGIGAGIAPQSLRSAEPLSPRTRSMWTRVRRAKRWLGVAPQRGSLLWSSWVWAVGDAGVVIDGGVYQRGPTKVWWLGFGGLSWVAALFLLVLAPRVNATVRRRGGSPSFLMSTCALMCTCSKTRGRGAGSAGRFAGDLGDVLVDVGEATQPAAGQYRAHRQGVVPIWGLAATGPRGCF